MAIDMKYGKVTVGRGDIGEDELVVVFRAQDGLLGEVLAHYHKLCVRAGSPRHHLDSILDTRDTILSWQEQHYTKVPTSDALRKDL